LLVCSLPCPGRTLLGSILKKNRPLRASASSVYLSSRRTTFSGWPRLIPSTFPLIPPTPPQPLLKPEPDPIHKAPPLSCPPLSPWLPLPCAQSADNEKPPTPLHASANLNPLPTTPSALYGCTCPYLHLSGQQQQWIEPPTRPHFEGLFNLKSTDSPSGLLLHLHHTFRPLPLPRIWAGRQPIKSTTPRTDQKQMQRAWPGPGNPTCE
jgi:hypothetical protein